MSHTPYTEHYYTIHYTLYTIHHAPSQYSLHHTTSHSHICSCSLLEGLLTGDMLLREILRSRDCTMCCTGLVGLLLSSPSLTSSTTAIPCVCMYLVWMCMCAALCMCMIMITFLMDTFHIDI
ncbi:hypothetical protein EON63_06210 [archaeon]|nr:MAG: hypothetical protein EON63_06210 [archaeon]